MVGLLVRKLINCLNLNALDHHIVSKSKPSSIKDSIIAGFVGRGVFHQPTGRISRLLETINGEINNQIGRK
jgi:hypothetical protein